MSDEAPVLPNTTPDLLLVTAVTTLAPGTDRETPPSQDQSGSSSSHEDTSDSAPELRASILPRTLSLRNSISKIMSEAGSETLEDEWQSISEIASTCNTILESLSREGQPILESGDPKETSKCNSEPEPGSLSEKVSHLESMLRKLQEDLQREKADRAALEEEVRSLRHNNQRLLAESESAATRLLLASKQLGSPTTDLA